MRRAPDWLTWVLAGMVTGQLTVTLLDDARPGWAVEVKLWARRRVWPITARIRGRLAR